MLRGPRWTRTARGFYTTGRVRLDADATCRGPSPCCRLAVIGGWAAAYALGVDWLDGLDHLTLKPLPVTVVLPPACGAARCRSADTSS